MSKHTPGPWEVKSGMSCRRVEDTHGGAVTIIYNHQEYNGEACGSITSQNKTDDELQANARIIAAAPELLEACEALLVMMGKQGGHRKLDDQLTWRANDEKAEATARAAIAKAKGEVHGGEC